MGSNGSVLPPIGEPAPPQPSGEANAEAAAFASGKLRRSETRDRHLHYCALVFLWCALLGFLAASGVWLWHIITPDKLHFLTDVERTSLQNILFTAVGSAAVGRTGKKYLSGDN